MITLQHRESLIQRAHLCALASQAGVNLAFEKIFDYGCDGNFSTVVVLDDGSRLDNGAQLDFQLKATTKAKVSDDTVSFVMEARDYNKLISRTNTGPPLMLILLVLPESEQEWVSFSEDDVVLRKCCFWKYLYRDKRTENKSKITVNFPRENLLVPDIITSGLATIADKNAAMIDSYSQTFGGHPK